MNDNLIRLLLFILGNILILFLVIIQFRKGFKLFQQKNFYLKKKRILFFIRIIILLVCNFLFFLIMGDPKFGKKKVPILNLTTDVVLMLDNSTSMLANDVEPNRFELSKLYIESILRDNKTSRYSLILFSSLPFIQIPFTENLDYFSFVLQHTNLTIKRKRSSKINNSLEAAQKILMRTPSSFKYIFVFSDMEFFDKVNKNIIQTMEDDNIQIFFIVIGTKKGSYIRIEENKLLKDSDGNIVQTRAEASNIIELSKFKNVNIINFEGISEKSLNSIKKVLSNDEKKYKKILYKPREIYKFLVILLLILFGLYFLLYSDIIKLDLSKEYVSYEEK